jgi:hypothetical protein
MKKRFRLGFWSVGDATAKAASSSRRRIGGASHSSFSGLQPASLTKDPPGVDHS